MGMKNIFQRWKNGLLGYRPSPEEIPTIQESIEQYRGRSDAPLLWVDGIRKVQLWQYDNDWIPFDKYCYVHGYNQYVEKDCIALWHRFHMPDPHDIGDLDVHSRMRVLADILPSRQPDEADIQAALAFWAALEASMYSMVWDNLYKYYDQDRRYFHIVEHYLKSQYDLELNRSDGYNAKTWLVTWYIVGCPTITQRNNYAVAIDKVVKVIEDWSTLCTGIPMFPPIEVKPCCEFVGKNCMMESPSGLSYTNQRAHELRCSSMDPLEKRILFTRTRLLDGNLSPDFKVRFGEVDHSFELIEPIEFNSFRPFNPLSTRIGRHDETTEHVINIDEVTQIFILVDDYGKVVSAKELATRDLNYFYVPEDHVFMKYVNVQVSMAYLLGNAIPGHHGGMVNEIKPQTI